MVLAPLLRHSLIKNKISSKILPATFLHWHNKSRLLTSEAVAGDAVDRFTDRKVV
jgi:hypothetical protein